MSEWGPSQMVEIVTIDEKLPPLQRIKEYTESTHSQHRLYIMRELLSHAEAIGYADSVHHVIDSIEQLLYDKEINIRMAIVENLPAFCLFLLKKGGKDANKVVFSKINPILYRLLVDKEPTIKEGFLEAIIKIAEGIDDVNFKDNILPLIEKLMNEGGDDYRILAIRILCKLAKVIGKEWTLNYLIPILQNKYQLDTIYQVRVAMITNMEQLLEVISTENVNNLLLPIYMELSKDEVWSVRKACASIITSLSSHISDDKRKTELLPIFESFAVDSTRWVRTAAFKELGPFIASFKSSFPQDCTLLQHYCKLVTDTQPEYYDQDHLLFCAYNFPAVLITVGAPKWSLLADIYKKLATCNQRQVRKSLASSIHVVAEILGEKTTEIDLLPIFGVLIRDFEEVKKSVLKNMAKFLKLVSPAKRMNYLYILDEIQHSSVYWRLRQLISKQIGDLAKLFDSKTSLAEIVPYVIALLQDPVASIRKCCLSQINKVFESLTSLPDKKQFINLLIELSTQQTHQVRLMYPKVCQQSISSVDRELYNLFIPHLLALVSDKVPNVRIALATTLLTILSTDPYKSDKTKYKETITKLKSDKDLDVLKLVSVL